MEHELAVVIMAYESDTFNAKAVKLRYHEAIVMALRLTHNLIKITAEGGSMYCDGMCLSGMLDDIRSGN